MVTARRFVADGAAALAAGAVAKRLPDVHVDEVAGGRNGDGLAAALRAPALARPVQITVDLRNALAALALVLLLLTWLPWRRSR